MVACALGPGEYGVYTINGQMHVGHIKDEREFFHRVGANMNFFGLFRYGKSYIYNDKYKFYLQTLRNSYPNTRFVVFTMPEFEPLYRLIYERGRGDAYARWLKETIEVFGEVHDFMGINRFTRNPTNFYDGHHFYVEQSHILVRRLKGGEIDGYDDFGIRVTKANLNTHLQSQLRDLHTIPPVNTTVSGKVPSVQ
ncbi:MAG: hypothetical protein HQ492_02775 [Woeseiaceae bacterium]|nr:hypothetical protein [Woeseiaceae bacterium]